MLGRGIALGERVPARYGSAILGPEQRRAVTMSAVAGILSGVVRVTVVMGTEPKLYPDSHDYLGIQGPQPWQGPSLFGGWRAPTAAVLFRLLDRPEAIVAAQALLGAVAWAFLAYALARSLRTRLMQAVGVVAVVGLGLTDRVVVWDSILLSESLSFSLLAAFSAACILAIHAWTWPRATGVAVVGLLYAFTRDTDAYVVGGVGLVVLASTAFGSDQLRRAITGGTLVTFFVAGVFLADVGERWLFPFYNVLGQRILTSPQATEYFVDHGMPDGPAVRAMAGAYGEQGFYTDPGLAELRSWATSRGRRTYAAYLLSHPGYTLLQPVRHAHQLVSDVGVYAPDDHRDPLPGWLDRLFLPPRGRLELAMLAVAAVALAVTAGRLRTTAIWLVPLVLTAAAVGSAYLVGHGDAREVGRHAVAVPVYVTLAAWSGGSLAVDAILLKRARSQPLETASSTDRA